MERLRAPNVIDDGVAVGKGDVMSGGDYVMNTNEGSTETIGDYGSWVRSDVCHLLDWLCFHVAVTDGCTGRCGADIVLTRRRHRGEVVIMASLSMTAFGSMYVFDECLKAILGGLLRVRERYGGVRVIGVV